MLHEAAKAGTVPADIPPHVAKFARPFAPPPGLQVITVPVASKQYPLRGSFAFTMTIPRERAPPAFNICVLLSRIERAVVYDPCSVSRFLSLSCLLNVALTPRV